MEWSGISEKDMFWVFIVFLRLTSYLSYDFFPLAYLSPVDHFSILSFPTYYYLQVSYQTKYIPRREFSIAAVAAMKTKLFTVIDTAITKNKRIKFDDLIAAKKNIFADISYFSFLWVVVENEKLEKFKKGLLL